MIGFATSGTTGPPVTWLHSQAQLDAEVRVLLPLLGRVDRVVTFAPPQHLYGRLLGAELPRLLGVPVVAGWADPLTLPPLRPGARHLLVCLPSTWPLLLRHVPVLRTHDVIAVHSTARTTDAVHAVADRLRGAAFAAVELLGSTETGAVASRAIAPGTVRADWTLLPDVTWSPAGDAEQRLHIRSPRLAHSLTSYEMGDLVVPTGARTFRHVGRASGLVKVNGRRCDLDHVAALVRRVAPEADARCVPVADPVRGEHYEIRYTVGPDPAELRARLAAVRGDLPAPRAVRRTARR